LKGIFYNEWQSWQSVKIGEGVAGHLLNRL
jgi:hypothetical protein